MITTIKNAWMTRGGTAVEISQRIIFRESIEFFFLVLIIIIQQQLIIVLRLLRSTRKKQEFSCDTNHPDSSADYLLKWQHVLLQCCVGCGN